MGLVLVTFSRHTDVLRKAILETPLVGKLKDEGINVQPEWANGAFVLAKIEPDAIDLEVNPLHPRHILVKDEDLLDLLGALEHLRYEHRKLKPDGLMAIPGPTVEMKDLSDSTSTPCVIRDPLYFTPEPYPVRNTFIHFR